MADRAHSTSRRALRHAPPERIAFAYLAAARQARLVSRGCVSRADAVLHREHARFWLALARRAQPPPLP